MSAKNYPLFEMAERTDVLLTLLILRIIFCNFMVKKPCFRQPDGVSITFGKKDLYYVENFSLPSVFLYQKKHPGMKTTRRAVCLLLLLVCGDIESQSGPMSQEQNFDADMGNFTKYKGIKVFHLNVCGI